MTERNSPYHKRGSYGVGSSVCKTISKPRAWLVSSGEVRYDTVLMCASAFCLRKCSALWKQEPDFRPSTQWTTVTATSHLRIQPKVGVTSWAVAFWDKFETRNTDCVISDKSVNHRIRDVGERVKACLRHASHLASGWRDRMHGCLNTKTWQRAVGAAAASARGTAVSRVSAANVSAAARSSNFAPTDH